MKRGRGWPRAAAVLLAALAVVAGGPSSEAATKRVARTTKTTKRRVTTRRPAVAVTTTRLVAALPGTTTTSAPSPTTTTAPIVPTEFLRAGQTLVLPSGTSAQITANGRIAVLTSAAGISFLDLTTGAKSALADELPQPLRATGASVSGDGRMVAIDTPDGVVDPRGSRRVVVFDRQNRALIPVGDVAVPQISADGTTVVFAAGVVALGRGLLQRYARRLPDGPVETIVTGPGNETPIQSTYGSVLSANGRRILFSNQFGGAYGVYLRDLDARTTTLVAATSFGGDLGLTADGRTALVVVVDPDDSARTNLAVVDVAARSSERIRRADGRLASARWGAIAGDGTSVAFLDIDDPAPSAPPGTPGAARHIAIRDLVTRSTREVPLDEKVLGEVLGLDLSPLSASSDLKVLATCASVKPGTGTTPASTTTTIAPGTSVSVPTVVRASETRCFVHRVS